MLKTKFIEIVATGLCFLVVYAGCEKYGDLRDESLLNERDSDSYNPYRHPVRGARDVFPIFYEPPHHNHEWYLPPEHQLQNRSHDIDQRGSSNILKTVSYPQELLDENAPNVNESDSSEIPLEIAKQIDTLGINEFLANYVDGFEDDQTPSFSVRFGGDERERSAAIPAKAKCSVENTTIEVANSDDPTVFYMPKCTKIERCSGCCSHKKLACRAIESEDILVEVYKLKWKVMNKKFNYVSKEVIPIERHIQCSCECKTRPEDCLPYQKYVEANCVCACTNTDEELKCIEDSKKKYWDPVSCSCKCLEYKECFTGSIYDQNECICKDAPQRRNVKLENHEYSRENSQLRRKLVSLL
ncbi:uncharacterized protein LOC130445053 [Diorhabda sublineata]|uniref:uncharacterized protein LOC130445053 n=1 Tax=Diorhabda sublineata TaxID=1163346 RepID=UPI0024E112D1|nr:uncharacterized protein LOC130445053 [Diorhabda sublineata]